MRALRDLILVTACCAVANTAPAQTLTQQSLEQVQTVLQRANEAYGGRDKVMGLRSMAIEFEDTNYSVNQSRGTAQPWDRGDSHGQVFIDVQNQVFANRVYGSGGGGAFANGTLLNGEQNFQVNYRDHTMTPIAEPDFANTSGPFVRVTPVLLLRQLNEQSRTAHYLGETSYQDRPHDVLTFSMTVGPAISLYVDRQSGLINRSERVFPGFGLVEYHFSDYETVDGIPLHKRFELRLNGDINLERNNLKMALDVEAAPFIEVPEAFAHSAPLAPDAFQRQAIHEGVYLIGGNGTYALFVEMEDYVLGIGGTAAVAASLDSLGEATDKPLRYGVLTHHHSDHVLGVAPYVNAGATVVAARAHEQVVRDAAPDGAQLTLELVDERRVFDDGQRVEIIDIGPTAHTEHLLVAWLPDSGLLFEADHFARPRTGVIPAANDSTRTFAEALRKHGLTPLRISSAHSPDLATPADLRLALESTPKATKAPMVKF